MQLRLQRTDTGEFLVLAANNVLTVEIHSTLFNSASDFLGSFSYDGSAPLQPNKAVLRNGHLINSSADLRTFDVMMYLGSLQYKQVRFNYTLDGDNIRYNLFIDSGVLANRFKNQNLNENPAGLDGQINFNSREDFANYMMETITAPAGTMPMVFYPFKNDGAYKVIPPESQGTYPDIAFPVNLYFNAWKITGTDGAFLIDTVSGENANTQTPAFYLVYVLRRLFASFGLKVQGKWLEDANANQITIPTILPISSFFSIADYTYYMPAIKVSDFLKEVRTSFGLLIDPDLTRNICTIESFENLRADSEYIDLQQKQLYGISETRTTLKSYKIGRVAEDSDSAFDDAEKQSMPTITIGDQSGINEIDDIPLLAVATKMLTEIKPAAAGTGSWRLPWIKLPVSGASPLDQISERDYKERSNFKLRFLYYHGMQLDSAGYYYPYASDDNLGPDGAAISDYSLALSQSSTAYLAVKRFYQYQKNSKPFEVGFFCTVQEFFKLNAKTRVILKDRNQAPVICLLDSVAADLGDKDTIFAKITVWPVVMANNAAPVVPIIPPIPPEPPVDNGVVYVKLVAKNTTRQDYYQPKPDWNTFKTDVVLYFYEDAAGTIPKAVTDLKISYSYFQSMGAYESLLGHITRFCNGSEVEIYHQEVIYTNQGGRAINFKYVLDAGAKYNVIATTWMPV